MGKGFYVTLLFVYPYRRGFDNAVPCHHKIHARRCQPGALAAGDLSDCSDTVCDLVAFHTAQDGCFAGVETVELGQRGPGVYLVGLEVGFILVYRAGWDISVAVIVVNVGVAVLLFPLGLLLFHEKLSPVNLIGILISIAGLVMVNVK